MWMIAFHLYRALKHLPSGWMWLEGCSFTAPSLANKLRCHCLCCYYAGFPSALLTRGQESYLGPSECRCSLFRLPRFALALYWQISVESEDLVRAM